MLIALGLVAAALLPGCQSASARDAAQYWPTKGWKTADPESQGMNSDTLDRIASFVQADLPNTTSIVVVRNGRIVFEDYYQGDKDTLRSMICGTKSVMSMLTGVLVTEGSIGSVDDRAVQYLPASLTGSLSPDAGTLTIRHLLTMTSGLPQAVWNDIFTTGAVPELLSGPFLSPPGESFLYGNSAPDMLSLIVEETSGVSTADFAEHALFEPLGIERYYWLEYKGHTYGAQGLQLTSRDAAKIGYLYLKRGVWEGKQLVDAAFVEDSTAPHVQVPDAFNPYAVDNLYYGYLWWVSEIGGHADFNAIGLWAHTVCVIPDLQMVIVVTQDGTPPDANGLMEGYIIGAVTDL